MSNATNPGADPTSAPAPASSPSDQEPSASAPAPGTTSQAPPPPEPSNPAPSAPVTSQQPSEAPAPTSQPPPESSRETSQALPPPPPPATSTTSRRETQPPPPQPEPTEPVTSVIGTTVVITPTVPGGKTSTIITVITQTEGVAPVPSNASPSPSSSATGTPVNSGSSSGGGLGNGGTIAVAVVVPIAAVALVILAGLYFWRKRKQRKHAEEERRKEVEDYGFNPNADPSIPALGDGGSYEMKEDGSSGYRGWGSTTLAGSTGRKASTTMSGGNTGAAYSDSSPTRGADTRSGEPLINDGSHSPDGEILGAMGPSAALNRGASGVQRGPSNASSSYSAGNRSDTSDGGIGVAYGGGGNPYYDQYGNNPYSDAQYGDQRPTELPGQPVIRDNPARRNTRIENPSHYPQQQNAGISQNF